MKVLTEARRKKFEEKKLKESIKEDRRQAEIVRRAAENSKKYQRRPPAFKTIHVDYTQLQTLRIDRKTTIYIKPGQDPEAAKKKFLKNYSKSLFLNNE